ncbi:MmgE/PrpD family protein [Egibacter rhizosphaerae]|nr:MmgE/PrpD family protein [Egibacter rhizosphaerae]
MSPSPQPPSDPADGDHADPWSAAIAAYATRPPEPMPAALTRATVDRVADAVGCALGAGAEDPAPRSVHRFADHGGDHPVWGTPYAAADPATAALANAALVRYLDANDAYHGIEPIHPSDVIPAVLAAARLGDAPATTALDGIATAYEVAMTAADAIAPTPRGFDHVNVTMLGAVAGCARAIGPSTAQATHAVAIAVTSHVALRQTRTGRISMWKAFAAADACRHALESARLAAAGVEGPGQPFVGTAGLFPLALGIPAGVGEAPVLRLPPTTPERLPNSQVKPYPCGSTIQAPAHAALRLVERGVAARDIARVDIHVGPETRSLHAGPDKLHPRTRETADHSVPFVVACILTHGELSIASFADEIVHDAELHAFLEHRVRVLDDPALDGGHDRGFPTRVEVIRHDGSSVREEVADPPGAPRSPLSPETLRRKFEDLGRRSALADGGAAAWEAVRALGEPGGRIEALERALRAPR